VAKSYTHAALFEGSEGENLGEKLCVCFYSSLRVSRWWGMLLNNG